MRLRRSARLIGTSSKKGAARGLFWLGVREIGAIRKACLSAPGSFTIGFGVSDGVERFRANKNSMKKFEGILALLILIVWAQTGCLAQVRIAQNPVQGPDGNLLFDESLSNDSARVNPTGVLVRDYQKRPPIASSPAAKKWWEAGFFAGEMIVASAFIYGAFAWGSLIYRQARRRARRARRAAARGIAQPLMVRRASSVRRRRSRKRHRAAVLAHPLDSGPGS